MSGFQVQDITGASQRLLVDDAGKINIGAGAPSERFCVLGVPVTKIQAKITNRRIVSNTCAPTTGFVNLDDSESANVTTQPGRRPIVSFEGLARAQARLDLNPPQQCTTVLSVLPIFTIDLSVGFFTIFNNNFHDPACSHLARNCDFAWM